MRTPARYVPPPPPDHDFEWHGAVKWPWFSARRRGHLLEQRVEDLERELLHIREYLQSHSEVPSPSSQRREGDVA